MRNLNKVGTVPVYLRDLSDQLQSEFLSRYRCQQGGAKSHMAKVVRAHEQGKDIIVGYYCQDADVEVRG